MLPETFPLPTVSLEEAIGWQFRLLEHVTAHFDGRQLFSADVGVTPEWGRPDTTRRVEAVLADYFRTPAAALVQGAGTAAIRAMLTATVRPGDALLIHAAPAYATTITAFTSMGLDLAEVDLNDVDALDRMLVDPPAQAAYIQHTRQAPADRYDVGSVITRCQTAGLPVLVDDNYAAFRVPHIGVELGADASAFSLFKLLGPEGVGLVVGTAEIVDQIHLDNYSGGGQVQGHQARDALLALVGVPVLWAVQSQVVTEVAQRLGEGEVDGVAEVRVANAQDRCLLIRFEQPVATAVVAAAARHGAAPYPVGANSRYEITPLFYRLSGSFLADSPQLRDWTIRVNPMRAGPDLVIGILQRALADVQEARCS